MALKKISSHTIRTFKDAARILYEKNMAAGFDGNLSTRNGKNFLITATRTYKGHLNAADVSIIDNQGEKLAGSRPSSSEYRLHLKIYEKRPDIRFIIHCHPLKSTLLTVIKFPLIPCFSAESFLFVGAVPTALFSLPGSAQLAETAAELSVKSDVVLLEKHGAVAVSEESFFDCLDKLEKLEEMSQKLLSLLEMKLDLNRFIFSPSQRKELRRLKETMNHKSLECQCDSYFCEKYMNWKKEYEN